MRESQNLKYFFQIPSWEGQGVGFLRLRVDVRVTHPQPLQGGEPFPAYIAYFIHVMPLCR